MKLRVTIPGKDAKKLKEKHVIPVMTIEDEYHEIDLVVVCDLNTFSMLDLITIYFDQIGVVDPGDFKPLNEILTEQTRGKATIEVMSFKEVSEPIQDPNLVGATGGGFN